MIAPLLAVMLAVTPAARAIAMRGGILFLIPAPDDACAVRHLTWEDVVVTNRLGARVTQGTVHHVAGSPPGCEQQISIEPGHWLPVFVAKLATGAVPQKIDVELERGGKIYRQATEVVLEALPALAPLTDPVACKVFRDAAGLHLESSATGKALLFGGVGVGHWDGPCEYPIALVRTGEALSVVDRRESISSIYFSQYSAPDACKGFYVEEKK